MRFTDNKMEEYFSNLDFDEQEELMLDIVEGAVRELKEISVVVLMNDQ